MAARHGTRTKYNAGCRCDPCVQVNRDYDKARKLAIRTGQHVPGKVTALPTGTIPAPAEPGRVEAGVMTQLAKLSTTEDRPGLVEIALAMARVLDNPLAIAQHGSTGKALAEIMDKIGKGADARRSKLASVRQMTRPDSATG